MRERKKQKKKPKPILCPPEETKNHSLPPGRERAREREKKRRPSFSLSLSLSLSRPPPPSMPPPLYKMNEPSAARIRFFR